MNDIEMTELSIDDWEEISRCHVVSSDSMMEFLDEIIEKSDTQAPLSSRRIKHTCEHCKKEFTDKRNLKRHMKTNSVDKEFQCSFCTRRFYRQDKDCMKTTVEDKKTSMRACSHGNEVLTSPFQTQIVQILPCHALY